MLKMKTVHNKRDNDRENGYDNDKKMEDNMERCYITGTRWT
jgi:hypothetical protein